MRKPEWQGERPEDFVWGESTYAVDIHGAVIRLDIATGRVQYLGTVHPTAQAVLDAAVAWAKELERKGWEGPHYAIIPGDAVPLYDAVRAYLRARDRGE